MVFLGSRRYLPPTLWQETAISHFTGHARPLRRLAATRAKEVNSEPHESAAALHISPSSVGRGNQMLLNRVR
jgi:hypothetical protein